MIWWMPDLMMPWITVVTTGSFTSWLFQFQLFDRLPYKKLDAYFIYIINMTDGNINGIHIYVQSPREYIMCIIRITMIEKESVFVFVLAEYILIWFDILVIYFLFKYINTVLTNPLRSPFFQKYDLSMQFTFSCLFMKISSFTNSNVLCGIIIMTFCCACAMRFSVSKAVVRSAALCHNFYSWRSCCAHLHTMKALLRNNAQCMVWEDKRNPILQAFIVDVST